MSYQSTKNKYLKLLSEFEVKKRALAQQGFAQILASVEKKHGYIKATADRVSKDFDVSRGSLLRSRIRKQNKKTSWHKRRLLNKQEESDLVSLVQEMGNRHTPMRRLDIIQMVKDLKGKEKKWDGSSWFRGFYDRNCNFLAKKVAAPIVGKRVSPDLVLQVKAFIKCWEKYRRQFAEGNGFCLVNVDETRVDSCVFGRKMVYIVSKDNSTPHIIEERQIVSISLLTFVTANGKTLLLVKVLPFFSKKQEKQYTGIEFRAIRKSKRNKTGFEYEATAYTITGWVTKEVWVKSIMEFCRIIKENYSGKNMVLFMDRLAAHKNKRAINSLKENLIEVLFFPIKTSHFLQPLDQLIFAIFKNGVRMDMMKAKQGRKLTKTQLLKVFLEVVERSIVAAMKYNIVSRSWRNTGVYPWSPSTIKQKLFENIGFSKVEFDALIKNADKSKFVISIYTTQD